jgi:hypothetical protein
MTGPWQWLHRLLALWFSSIVIFLSSTTIAYDFQQQRTDTYDGRKSDFPPGYEKAAVLPQNETWEGVGVARAIIPHSGGFLAAESGAPIARITPGSLPASEEASLLQTVGHIDAGTTPTGSIGTKWGTPFKNWAGDLPGPSGVASPYLEYRVAPPPGTSGAGPLRVVANQQSGVMYYTWTHYGDAGPPAFVQIR